MVKLFSQKDICTAQKIKFPIKDFFSKSDQIRSCLWIWSYFCVVWMVSSLSSSKKGIMGSAFNFMLEIITPEIFSNVQYSVSIFRFLIGYLKII